jgi:hypothetical protein
MNRETLTYRGFLAPSEGEAVGAAWDDVVEHMPEGWIIRHLTFVPLTSKHAARRGPHWRAQACRRTDLGLGVAGMVGIGTTADAALTRLAGLLEGVKR